MTERTPRQPGPDHPITIEPAGRRMTVSASGEVIADTRDALMLREASYPPVRYIPRSDVDMSKLTRSERTTYCPYKGNCNYYSLPAGGPRGVDAVWTYEAPYPAVAAIAGHLAFYPDRVDIAEPQAS